VEDERQRRIADNECVCRDINEAIASGRWPGEPDAPVGFRCECAQLGCSDVIELSARAYERVRQNGRRFVIAAGHQALDGETVVEAQSGYVVVEKQGQAGSRAEAKDPRS